MLYSYFIDRHLIIFTKQKGDKNKHTKGDLIKALFYYLKLVLQNYY